MNPPTPPKVQAPPPPEPPEWMVDACHEILGNYWEGRGPPFDREVMASAVILARHASSPAPASEGRSEEKEAVNDMTTAESGVISAASEFIRDWRKGDFTLPPLAVHDATHLENTLLECKKKLSTNLGPTPLPSECKAQHAVDYFTKNRPAVAAHYPGAGEEVTDKEVQEYATKICAVLLGGEAEWGLFTPYGQEQLRNKILPFLYTIRGRTQSAGRDVGRGGAT